METAPKHVSTPMEATYACVIMVISLTQIIEHAKVRQVNLEKNNTIDIASY